MQMNYLLRWQRKHWPASLWHSWNSQGVNQSSLFCEHAGTTTSEPSSSFKFMAALFWLCHFPSQKSYVFVLQVTIKLFSRDFKACTVTSHYALVPPICFDSVRLPPIVSNLSGFKSMSYIRFLCLTPEDSDSGSWECVYFLKAFLKNI